MNCRQQLGDELCEIGGVHWGTRSQLSSLVESSGVAILGRQERGKPQKDYNSVIVVAGVRLGKPPMDQSDFPGTAVSSAHNLSVTVLYFARLRETLERSSERLELPAGVSSVGRLREYLRSRGGAWEVELASTKPVRVAVNQDMANSELQLSDGDEVAFFPPVTGG